METPKIEIPEMPFVWWVKTDSTGRIVEECYTVRGLDQTKFKNVQQVRDELAKHSLPDIEPAARCQQCGQRLPTHTPGCPIGKQLAAAARAPASVVPQIGEDDEPHRGGDELVDDPAWCPIHECEMKRRTKDGDVWYSHKTADGDFCRGGREPAPKKHKR